MSKQRDPAILNGMILYGIRIDAEGKRRGIYTARPTDQPSPQLSDPPTPRARGSILQHELFGDMDE